jgi:hypothetical protein
MSNNILNQIYVFGQYVLATKCLFKDLESKTERDRPNHIYPIAYLFRHSLELGIKLLIQQLSGEYIAGHDIGILRKRCVAIIDDKSNESTILVLNEQQRAAIEVEFGGSEEINGITKQEWFEKFTNYNLSVFLELLDKYLDDDAYNTRFRYSDSDISYAEKVSRYIEIQSDINTLHDLMVFLNMAMFTAVVDLKEHETHQN